VSALDRKAFDVDREQVLSGLFSAAGAIRVVAERDGVLEGFGCARPGAARWYIGPVVATERDISRSLIAALVSRLEGQPVVMDLFDADLETADVCRDLGLQPVRPFVRMVRGPFELRSRASYRAIAGPEIG
jgi:hypothetical protein